MYNIAVVNFLTNDTMKSYEYRIPKYLDGRVTTGDLGIVSWKSTHEINPTVVRIKEVKSVLDGEYEDSYAYMVGAVDDSEFREIIEKEKKRKRLMNLIKNEQKKLVNDMDFDKLSAISPEIKELVDQLKAI